MGELLHYNRLLMITFGVERQNIDQLNDSGCTMLTPFSVRNKTVQGEAHNQRHSIIRHNILRVPPIIWQNMSTESGGAKVSQRSSAKRPRACEFTPFSDFPPLHFMWRHRHVYTVVWLRAPQGLAEGREFVYFNTFMPYTMFSLWSWLSPAGPSR